MVCIVLTKTMSKYNKVLIIKINDNYFWTCLKQISKTKTLFNNYNNENDT